MSKKAIRALLDGRLATWAAAHSPVLPVAFENVFFTRPALGTTYLRAFMLPNPTDSADVQGVHRHYYGIYQVSIVAPLNGGPGAAETIAGELAALFPTNLRLTSTLTVQVMTPASDAPAIVEPDAYVVPVSFSYRADTIS